MAMKMGFLRSGAVGDFIGDLAKGQQETRDCDGTTRLRTYDVDAAIPRNSNTAVEGTQIYAHNRHVDGGMAG